MARKVGQIIARGDLPARSSAQPPGTGTLFRRFGMALPSSCFKRLWA
jgi:hypothetical protein